LLLLESKLHAGAEIDEKRARRAREAGSFLASVTKGVSAAVAGVERELRLAISGGSRYG
jgi:hypothetical protein